MTVFFFYSLRLNQQSLHPSQQFFSHVGIGLLWLNLY